MWNRQTDYVCPICCTRLWLIAGQQRQRWIFDGFTEKQIFPINSREITEFSIASQGKLKYSEIWDFPRRVDTLAGPSQPGLAPGVNGAPNPLKNEKNFKKSFGAKLPGALVLR